MMQLVRQRDELRSAKRLLQTIKGIGDKTALTSIAAVPELGLISNKAAAALVGVAPFVRKSGTMNARTHISMAAAHRYATPSTWPPSPPAVTTPSWPRSTPA
jgi:transposase